MKAPFATALFVEDEPNLATAIEIALRKMRIQAMHASTLAQARALLRDFSPELLLLDRALPDGDGLTLCQELRQNGYDGAILILTAAGQVEDRIRGLQIGADDYLSKPFSWEELEARIHAIARRLSSRVALPSSDSWEIDEKRLRIRSPSGKGWVELTPLEFKLAMRLINARGEIVSRDQLLRDVWGFTLLPKTRTVDLFMSRLRKLFEADPENPKHFVTVRGAGYRFEE